MIEGAISFQEMTCKEAMTSIEKVGLFLEMDTVMDRHIMEQMKKEGFHQVPVIHKGCKNHIIGVLLVASCLGLDLSHKKTLRQLYVAK